MRLRRLCTHRRLQFKMKEDAVYRTRKKTTEKMKITRESTRNEKTTHSDRKMNSGYCVIVYDECIFSPDERDIHSNFRSRFCWCCFKRVWMCECVFCPFFRMDIYTYNITTFTVNHNYNEKFYMQFSCGLCFLHCTFVY